jgi:GNAT superfamily N-acetyltransferase
MNYAVGAGLSGPVSGAEVDRLVDFYVPHGIEPRVELCPLADPTFVSELERAGFALRALENVLFRPVSRDEVFTTPYPAPPGLVIEQVDASDPAAVRAYTLAAMAGFLPPDTPGMENFIESSERVARNPRTRSFVARMPAEAGGTIVCAGAMAVDGEVAALFGLTTLEPFRRRGIQQAMIAHRLKAAAAGGAKVVTIGSRPGAHTERNVRRMGFQVAYTKPVLAKAGPGLAPALG